MLVPVYIEIRTNFLQHTMAELVIQPVSIDIIGQMAELVMAPG